MEKSKTSIFLLNKTVLDHSFIRNLLCLVIQVLKARFKNNLHSDKFVTTILVQNDNNVLNRPTTYQCTSKSGRDRFQLRFRVR